MCYRGNRKDVDGMKKPVLVNANPCRIMQVLYSLKARQEGSDMEVNVREITEEEARTGGVVLEVAEKTA